jgi:hypothetical protein
MTFTGALKHARSLANREGGTWYVVRISTGYAVERWLAWGDEMACRVQGCR